MRLLIACTVVAGATGCELLYNPSNLKGNPDAVPDVAQPDADPNHPVIMAVDAAALYEGTGDDPAGRQGLLVINGYNFVSSATVTVAAKNGGDNAKIVAGTPTASADNHWLAVPVIAQVGAQKSGGACDSGTLPLTITITQGAGQVSTDWSMTCLPQAVSQSSNLSLSTAMPNLYAQISLTTGATIVAADKTNPLIVRSMSSLTIAENTAMTTAIDASASGQTAGPGGSAGPGQDASGNGPGKGGAGNNATLLGNAIGGGGAGFAAAGTQGGGSANGGPMVGEPLVSSFAANVASSGGSATGLGGASGGTIELSANGLLTVPEIDAPGAGGGNSTGLGGANGGGGGAGGVIVLRGTTVTVNGKLVATGGSGGAGASQPGGAGSDGRIRIDAQMRVGAPSILPAEHVGIAFDATQPYTSAMAMVGVANTGTVALSLHGTSGDMFDVYTLDATEQTTRFEVDGKQITGGAGQLVINPQLAPGFNRVCLVPSVTPKASVVHVEGRTCIDVAYLPSM